MVKDEAHLLYRHGLDVFEVQDFRHEESNEVEIRGHVVAIFAFSSCMPHEFVEQAFEILADCTEESLKYGLILHSVLFRASFIPRVLGHEHVNFRYFCDL